MLPNHFAGYVFWHVNKFYYSGADPRDGKAGRADLFNPLTRISPPRISPRPTRASCRAGRVGPLTRKKKNCHCFNVCR